MLEDLRLAPPYDGFLFLAESVRNPPVLRPHHHAELELNLVAAGEITYVVEGQRYTFGKGTLLWMFSSQEHQLVDRTSDAAYYVAVFKPDMIHRACHGERYAKLKRNELSEKGVLNVQLSASDFDLLRLEMDRLIADGMDLDLLNREAGFGLSRDFRFRHSDPDWLNAGLRHLLLSAWRLQQSGGSAYPEVVLHRAVRRALDWIDREQEMEKESLPRYCGVSHSYLSRLFHQQVGVPLSRYRNSARLGRFWEAYRRRDTITVMEAAFEAGFGSYAQFFRVFSQAYGSGPRALL